MMNWLSRLKNVNPLNSPRLVLEVEGLPPRTEPTIDDVKGAVLGLGTSGWTFATLTQPNGDYIQFAGSRPWCLIEQRSQTPPSHSRAFRRTPNPKYKDGAKLRTGAGDITMKHDEWFLLKDAAAIVEAYQAGADFPKAVEWRSMNELLGL